MTSKMFDPKARYIQCKSITPNLSRGTHVTQMGMVMVESVVLVVGCSRNSWRYTAALRIMSHPQQMDRQLGGPKQIRHKLISNKQWLNGKQLLNYLVWHLCK